LIESPCGGLPFEPICATIDKQSRAIEAKQRIKISRFTHVHTRKYAYLIAVSIQVENFVWEHTKSPYHSFHLLTYCCLPFILNVKSLSFSHVHAGVCVCVCVFVWRERGEEERSRKSTEWKFQFQVSVYASDGLHTVGREERGKLV
jgi:hypothetical protein